MNIAKLTALAVAAVVVTGCATTAQFNPNNRGIAFVDGKPYLIPYGAKYTKNRQEFETILKMFNDDLISRNCSKKNVLWMDNNYIQNRFRQAKNKRPNMSNSEGHAILNDIFRTAYNTHRIGCPSPLSATEYDYYKTVEVQRSQQMMHQQNLQMQQNMYDAVTRPKTCITLDGYTSCL